MALDASDFPMEGQNLNSDRLLPPVDFLIRNMGKVHREIGGRRPTYVPNFGQTGVTPAQAQIIEEGMPGQNNTPDMPNPNRLPAAKMMPGCDTEPGKVISQEDQIAIQKKIAEKNALFRYDEEPFDMFNQGMANRKFSNVAIQKEEKTSFFKDLAGNQYKTIGDKLYVLGWQDADIKIRVMSEKTNKEIPSAGKKFQIYGWHLVKKVTDSEEIVAANKIDDITEKLSTIRVKDNDEIKKTETTDSEVHDISTNTNVSGENSLYEKPIVKPKRKNNKRLA